MNSSTLKRDGLPPGFDGNKLEWDLEQEVAEKLRDNHRFARLYEAEKGWFGNRPGNPWRMSRRRWIETFVKIQAKNGKIVPLILNTTQRRLEAEILRMERAGVPVRIIILKARQEGCSTYIAALELWYAMTHPHGMACIIAQKNDISKSVFEKLGLMVVNMQKPSGEPWAFQLQRKASGRLTFGLPLAGDVTVESAEVDEPMRGRTVQVLHKSESPIWPDAERKSDAVNQVVADEQGTYAFDEATANGDFGVFPREFKRAWRENRMGRPVKYGWRGFFAPWYWDQGYRWSKMTGSPPDKDQAAEIVGSLDQEETALLKITYLVRGRGWVKVDIDQLAWRRFTIQNKCRGSLDAFHQEYPSTPEEAFLSSGMPYFAPAMLQKQRELGLRPPLFVGTLLDDEAERLLAHVRLSHQEGDETRDAG